MERAVPTQVRRLLAAGELDRALAELHRAGFAVGEAAAALHEGAGVALDTALEQVWAHPGWRDEAEASRAVVAEFGAGLEGFVVRSDDGGTWVLDPELG